MRHTLVGLLALVIALVVHYRSITRSHSASTIYQGAPERTMAP